MTIKPDRKAYIKIKVVGPEEWWDATQEMLNKVNDLHREIEKQDPGFFSRGGCSRAKKRQIYSDRR